MYVQIAVKKIEKIVEELVASGIGRNASRNQPNFDFESLESPIWVKSAKQAEKLQESDELGDFLLCLRPDGVFDDNSTRQEFGRALNDVAEQVKTICEIRLSELSIPGFKNEPVGFQPPYATQTLEFIIISLAQELYANMNYGLTHPLPCHDLIKVYQEGHIVCGYDSSNAAVVLY